AGIKLTHRSGLLGNADETSFDCRRPQTWGGLYDSGNSFIVLLYIISVERAVEVAEAAMPLSQALRQKPTESFALLFNTINTEEVTQSLARTHTALGDPNEAIAWAKQIGSADQVPAGDKNRVSRAVQ